MEISGNNKFPESLQPYPLVQMYLLTYLLSWPAALDTFLSHSSEQISVLWGLLPNRQNACIEGVKM